MVILIFFIRLKKGQSEYGTEMSIDTCSYAILTSLQVHRRYSLKYNTKEIISTEIEIG